MLGTQPDIAFAVTKLSQFASNPTEEHLGKALYICCYLLVLRFYPHFSTFLTHVTPHALSFPCHLPRALSMCLQITGFIFMYIALTCIILFAHVLVWFLTAVP